MLESVCHSKWWNRISLPRSIVWWNFWKFPWFFSSPLQVLQSSKVLFYICFPWRPIKWTTTKLFQSSINSPMKFIRQYWSSRLWLIDKGVTTIEIRTSISSVHSSIWEHRSSPVKSIWSNGRLNWIGSEDHEFENWWRCFITYGVRVGTRDVT